VVVGDWITADSLTIRSMLKYARERDRWMVSSIQKIADKLNAIDPGGFEPIELDDLDIDAGPSGFLSDAESEEDNMD